ELIMGRAELTGPDAVTVELRDGGRRVLRAGTIVINAGCRPSTPPVAGLDAGPALDSTSIMEPDGGPGHLLVLGGGYVGLEFGQMFRRFGARVTIVQRGPALLAREDPDVAEAVAGIMREDGIDVLLDADATAAASAPGGRVRLDVRAG